METYLAHNTRSQVTGVALDLILSTDWDFGTAVSVTLHKRDAVRGKEKKILQNTVTQTKGKLIGHENAFGTIFLGSIQVKKRFALISTNHSSFQHPEPMELAF